MTKQNKFYEKLIIIFALVIFIFGSFAVFFSLNSNTGMTYDSIKPNNQELNNQLINNRPNSKKSLIDARQTNKCCNDDEDGVLVDEDGNKNTCHGTCNVIYYDSLSEIGLEEVSNFLRDYTMKGYVMKKRKKD